MFVAALLFQVNTTNIQHRTGFTRLKYNFCISQLGILFGNVTVEVSSNYSMTTLYLIFIMTRYPFLVK